MCSEQTPHRPTTRKGRLRENMERAFESAASDGVRTIVVRAGDFIDTQPGENWFEGQIAKSAGDGRLTYPGPTDRKHAWAFLPDFARVFVELAERRVEFAPFETFNFDGYALTGVQLVAAIENVMGRRMKVSAVPWPILRALGVVSPQLREVAEVSYLWRTPHELDGSKLRAVAPGFQPTKLNDAIRVSLQGIGVLDLVSAVA